MQTLLERIVQDQDLGARSVKRVDDPVLTILLQNALNADGANLVVDGIWGKKTQAAYDKYEERLTSTSVKVNSFPSNNWKELVEFYGTPDFSRGIAPHGTYLTLPYPMKLSWDLDVTVTRIRCHELVADSLYNILEEISKTFNKKDIVHYGLNLYGGCTHVRPARGKKFPSRHSLGIAIDIDPVRNGLYANREQSFMPQAAINIFTKNGWTSGGEAWGRDFMHFQATSTG